jgi:hypothetical protein
VQDSPLVQRENIEADFYQGLYPEINKQPSKEKLLISNGKKHLMALQKLE